MKKTKNIIFGIAMNNAKAGQMVNIQTTGLFKVKNNKCIECSNKLKTKDEKEFGECDKCCAWKYRGNCD